MHFHDCAYVVPTEPRDAPGTGIFCAFQRSAGMDNGGWGMKPRNGGWNGAGGGPGGGHDNWR